ncbi:trichodiene oxygenase [Aspergillus udagawae]|uniref:Trichodiene oxygenase n=1 Tax=Aspergillus udagawae TaxID=91492 RepID=A0A8H3NI11_9EURO|nr:trichodiene oxygenase [Aspergillus udagawae]
MMLSSSWLLLALAYSFLYFLVQSIYRLFFHPLSRYPGPKLTAATFLYEFYYDVIKGGQFLFQIERMHERYGPVVRINPRELHIKDPSFYDTIYAGGTHKRDKDPGWVHISGAPLSTFSTVSHDHHRFRRSILSDFFSKKSVTALSPIIEERVLKLMQRFQEAYDSKSAIRVDAAFAGLTADVITHYAYGKSWGFLEDPQFRSNIRAAVNEATKAVHLFRFFPFLVTIFRTIPAQVMCFVQPGKTALLEFQKSIFDHAAQPQSKRNDSARTIFHRLTDPSIPPEERSLARIQDEAFIILAAGTETTARTLTIATFYMANEPRIWKKLRDELQSSVLPTLSSTATWTELEKLPYLNAVINEALRLSYGAVIRLPRVAPTETLKYKDYAIPPGTPVSMSTYFVHQDPSIFPDPQTFRPERWIEASDQPERLTKYIVSFTRGSRICLGMNLAYIELFMTIAYMVRRFDMVLHETTFEDIRIVRDYVLGLSKHGDLRVFTKVTNMLQE